MTWMQRRFFERRERERVIRMQNEWDRRREAEGEETLAALASLSEPQRRAIERVLQRVIDGRAAILARSPDLPEAALREARGAIMGLQDLADGLRELWEGRV